MANDTARHDCSRSGDLFDQIGVLHDRLIVAEDTVGDACEHVTRETVQLRKQIIELRTMVTLFGSVALMSLIIALIVALTVLTR